MYQNRPGIGAHSATVLRVNCLPEGVSDGRVGSGLYGYSSCWHDAENVEVEELWIDSRRTAGSPYGGINSSFARRGMEAMVV